MAESRTPKRLLDSTLVDTTSSQTLSNKELTAGTNTYPTFNQNTTGSAAKLTTARTVQTALGSTASASFDGTANITPGVSGTLAVGNGGTGTTTSTGSGNTVLSTSPTLVTPALGTPSALVLTNATGLTNAGLATTAGELGAGWTTYTPSVSGFSAAPTNTVYAFKQIGKIVYLHVRQGTNGTSNSTAFTIGLPVTAVTRTNEEWNSPCQIVNNGTTSTTPGLMVVSSGGTDLNVYINYAGTTFTASGGKRLASGTIIYEAA